MKTLVFACLALFALQGCEKEDVIPQPAVKAAAPGATVPDASVPSAQAQPGIASADPEFDEEALREITEENVEAEIGDLEQEISATEGSD